MKIKKTVTLKATVSGKSKKTTWTSSNTKVATVKNGVVTGKKRGTVTITAKANGKTATCKVTVKDPVYSKVIKLIKDKKWYKGSTTYAGLEYKFDSKYFYTYLTETGELESKEKIKDIKKNGSYYDIILSKSNMYRLELKNGKADNLYCYSLDGKDYYGGASLYTED